MSENSKIEWTTHTFNPWIGCTKVSPGCAQCYAETLMDKRYGRVSWGKGNPRSLTSNENWKLPYRWNRNAKKSGNRSRVFCASLADVFDSEVPQEWRDRLWTLVAECDSMDWLLLTKRLNLMDADELLAMMPDEWRSRIPQHIWFGHSICTQVDVDLVLPRLLRIPAAVRFLSCEPLLEEITVKQYFLPDKPTWAMGNAEWIRWLDRPKTWVIIGGESGANARPFDLAWARSLIHQCQDANVPVFMKQLGSKPKFKQYDDYPSTGKGNNPDEWPEDLRVRDHPKT